MSGASHFEVRNVGRSRYAVFNADGVRISGILGSQDHAFAQAAAASRRTRLAPRACMRCGGEFVSEGSHNRMCDPCRSRPQSASGFDDCHSTAGTALRG